MLGELGRHLFLWVAQPKREPKKERLARQHPRVKKRSAAAALLFEFLLQLKSWRLCFLKQMVCRVWQWSVRSRKLITNWLCWIRLRFQTPFLFELQVRFILFEDGHLRLPLLLYHILLRLFQLLHRMSKRWDSKKLRKFHYRLVIIAIGQ